MDLEEKIFNKCDLASLRSTANKWWYRYNSCDILHIYNDIIINVVFQDIILIF